MLRYFFTKIINKYKFLLLMMAIFIPSVFLFPPTILSSGSYVDSGIITSTNLLPTTGSLMINSVTYNASALPSGTSLKMQFSYDGLNWYSSTGVIDALTPLSSGTNTIDLSNMGWKKLYFYYRVVFVSDGNDTPVLNSVSLSFIGFDGTFVTYSSSGILTSNNILPSEGVSSVNSFGYTLSSLPPNTSVQIQFSQDGNSWYGSSGVLNDFNTLSAGTNSINLAGLGWSSAFYYKTTLISSDGIDTPILNGITLSYTSNYYYWVGGSGGSWNNSANWSGASGGTGGIGVPTSADTAIFDAGNTNSGVIDTNIQIGNIKLNSGYTGAITQATTSVITVMGTTTVNAGTLTLAGANNISGNVILNAGRLNINNAGAIGTSTLTIASGTIDNTSGASITLSSNNLQNWNGNFTFAGTNDLNLGIGTTTLGTSTVVSVGGTDKVLTIDGVISGAHSLTKTGAGSLTLNKVNTYSGGTTLGNGTLNINNSLALGSGAFSQTGGALKVYGSNNLSYYFNISSGTVDFYDNSIFSGIMDITTAHTANFNNLSYNTGIINGDAEFAYATSGTASLSGSMVWGTVTGSIKGLADNISINHWIFLDNSFNNGTTTVASSSTMKFYDTSYNGGVVSILSGGVIDFYDSSVNENKINIASGGILNFHDSSSNNNGTISVAVNGAVNFYDSSFNKDGLATVASGGGFDFYNYSYNNGDVNGNVVFHNDISQNIGTINGSTTRQYDVDATTTRNFNTDGGHSDWIIIAKGVIVNISNAIYSLATNIFKAFANGFFIFGNNSAGGPVVPQISIISPFVGTSTIKWVPSINYGVDASSTCQYKIDSESYQTVDCTKNGSDIPRPTAGEHTLWVKAIDVKGNLSEKSIVFTYDNTAPVWTSCGSDLLDEATRPYYYLAENITGDCHVTTNIEFRGAYATNTPGYILTGSVISDATSTNGFNITLKDITVTGTTSAMTTASGKDGGNITVENSIVGTLISDGAEGTIGGKAGNITVATSSTGIITANGGSGTSQGSNGGTITVWNSDGLLASTLVESLGGNATQCGNGGEGGDITITNSNYYVALSDSGLDQIETGTDKCAERGTSSSHIKKTPIVVARPVPPSASTNTNTNQGGNIFRKAFVQGTINQIILPVQKLNPIKLTKLPTFGEDKKGSFSFKLPIQIFLFNLPTASITDNFKKYPKLKKYITDTLHYNTDQKLVSLYNKPLKLDAKASDVLGIFKVISPKNNPLVTTLKVDKKGNFSQYIKVNTKDNYQTLNLQLALVSKTTITGKLNDTKYTFTNNTKNITTTINLPQKAGTYTFTTSASPLPLVIEVIGTTLAGQANTTVGDTSTTQSWWSKVKLFFSW